MHSSKKLLLITAVCIIALGSVIAVKSRSENTYTAQKPLTLSVQTQPRATTTIEALKNKISNSSKDAKVAPPSITNTLSQDFAKNYTNLFANGELTLDSQAKLINDIATNYATHASAGLTIGDISTFSDRDKDKVKNFGNAVAKAIISHYPELKTSPLDIIADAANNKTSTTTLPVSLSAISKAYRSIAVDLQRISAPANIAADYLGVINGYIEVADNVDDMKTYFTDPVRGFIGISNYQKNFPHQLDLLKTIAIYFNTNGILFSNGEPGNIWSSLTQ